MKRDAEEDWGRAQKRSPVAGAEQEIVVIEYLYRISIQTDEAPPPPPLSLPPSSSPSGMKPGF
jgi:hypothetical protein